jgi:hypothetical protein
MIEIVRFLPIAAWKLSCLKGIEQPLGTATRIQESHWELPK